jgi:hypothetical protein
MFKIACEITNLLKDGKATIAEATLTVNGQEAFVETGKAICNPKDDFDEKAGVKIATARAKAKCYNKLYSALSKCENTLYDLIDDLESDMSKVDDRLSECQDTIADNAYPDEEDDDSDDSDLDEKPSNTPKLNTDSDEKDE